MDDRESAGVRPQRQFEEIMRARERKSSRQKSLAGLELVSKRLVCKMLLNISFYHQ